VLFSTEDRIAPAQDEFPCPPINGKSEKGMIYFLILELVLEYYEFIVIPHLVIQLLI
jgi:hypothetical protein